MTAPAPAPVSRPAAAQPPRRRPEVLGPFVVLEALRAARNGRTFVLRAVVLLVLLLMVLAGMAIGELFSKKPSVSQLAEAGRVTFWFFVIAQSYLVCLVAPVLGAAAIVEEREEGTAGLLLLTPLPSWQLLGGKFLGKLVTLELVLLSGLPLLALTLALGGVDWREALASSLLVQLTLVGAASVGLFGAALQLSTPGCAIAAYAFLGIAWWLPAIPGRWAGSPLSAMVGLLITSAPPSWGALWPSLASSGLTVLLCLVGAAPLFARVTEEQAPPRRRLLLWRLASALIGAGGFAAAFTLAVLALKGRLPAGLASSGGFAALLTSLASVALLASLTAVFLPRGPVRRKERRRGRADATVWNNPVAWREWFLRGRAYGVQLGVDGLCLLGTLALLSTSEGRRFDAGTLAAYGALLHSLGYWWLVLLGAQSFVVERRARTLELMAVAPLEAWRVVTGKLVGIARRAVVPFGLSYLLLAGGGSPTDLLRTVAGDTATVGMAVAISLWARSTRVAYGTVLGLVTLQSALTSLPARTVLGIQRKQWVVDGTLTALCLAVGIGALLLAASRFRRWAAR